MMKRLFAIIAVAMFALLVSACGGSAKPAESDVVVKDFEGKPVAFLFQPEGATFGSEAEDGGYNDGREFSIAAEDGSYSIIAGVMDQTVTDLFYNGKLTHEIFESMSPEERDSYAIEKKELKWKFKDQPVYELVVTQDGDWPSCSMAIPYTQKDGTKILVGISFDSAAEFDEMAPEVREKLFKDVFGIGRKDSVKYFAKQEEKK